MSEQWYYEIDGTQTGPVDRKTLEILIAKNVVTHKSMVWAEGMSDWVPASRVKGLVTSPPPMPGKAPTAPNVVPAASAAAPTPQDAGRMPAPQAGRMPAPQGKPSRSTTGSVHLGAAKHKKDEHGHSTRKNAMPVRKGTNPVLYAAGGLLVCAALVGVFYFINKEKEKKVEAQGQLTRPKPAAKPEATQSPAATAAAQNFEPTDPQQKRVWLLNQYDIAHKEKPGIFQPLLERLDAMGQLFDEDRQWQMAVKERRDTVLTAMEHKASEMAEPLGKNAVKLIEAYQYRDALQELDKFPAELRRTIASNRVLFYRSRIEKIATEQFESAADRVTALMNKRDFGAAMKALDVFNEYGQSRIGRQVSVQKIEIGDARDRGLNPSEGKDPKLNERLAYLKSDVYIGLNGMVERYQHAVRAALMGNSVDAMALTDMAEYPRSAVFYYARAVAQIRDGKSVEAAWSLKQAKRLALPGDAFKSRLLAAEARLAEVDFDMKKAQAKCDEALATDPKNADAHFARGMMWAILASFVREGNDADVRQCMEQARDSMKSAGALDSDYLQFVEQFATAETPDKYKVKGTSNPHLTSAVQISGDSSAGSGWCVKANGTTAYIVTNNHVIEGQNGLSVVYQLEVVGNLVKKTSTAVKVLKTDTINDLALLEVVTEKPLKALPMRQTVTGLRVPMPVTLIGSPGAGDRSLDFTVISGEISNIDRVTGGGRKLQFNANSDHGMSGGPVIDEKGRVIGVIVSGFIGIRGQGFAIISEHVRDLCKDAGIEVELQAE